MFGLDQLIDQTGDGREKDAPLPAACRDAGSQISTGFATESEGNNRFWPREYIYESRSELHKRD